MIYGYIVAALAIFGAGFGTAWQWQANTYDVRIMTIRSEVQQTKLDAAKAQTAAVNKARLKEQAISKTYQEALNDARKDLAAARASDARARAESERLREQAADAARRLAAAPPAAVLDYALALDSVFGDCRKAYGELVQAADGHAADARTLTASWPVNKTE